MKAYSPISVGRHAPSTCSPKKIRRFLYFILVTVFSIQLYARYTACPCRLCNSFCYNSTHLFIQSTWDNIIYAQLFITYQGSNRICSGNLHFLIDIACVNIQGTTEDTRECQNIVDLISKITAPGSYHEGTGMLQKFLSGMISGTGFAIGRTMDFSFMLATIASLTTSGADTPMKISLPFMASARLPFNSPLFGQLSNLLLPAFMPSLPLYTLPLESHRITSPKFIFSSKRAIAIPAEPAPLMTMRRSCCLLPSALPHLTKQLR